MRASKPAPDFDSVAYAGGNGRKSDAAMTRAVERLADAEQRSTAEMLSDLRRAFPHSPLAVRVRALDALRKR